MVRRRLTASEQLEAARSGDREALGDLLAAHYDRVFAVCLRMLHDRSAAEDCAQEAMIRIARGLSRFDGRSAVSTWCHRIAVTTALDAVRHARRRPMSARVDPDATTREHIDEDAHASVIGSVERAELRDSVAIALASIPQEFARAVVMRDVADLDYAEIAEIEQVAVGTVKSRISRGRAALNERLAGNQALPDRRLMTTGSEEDPE